ncbi:MAG: response regulator [Cyanobacteria bacterium J06621_11]
MRGPDEILAFAESLIHQTTDTYCSELQRRILSSALDSERKTYDQLAEECAYSAKYVKQDVAPKLWQVLSQSVGEKVTKANVRLVLTAAMNKRTSNVAADATLPNNAPQTKESVLSAPELTLSANKQTILLVDDEPDNLRLLSDLLDEQGHEVQQAISGEIALQSVVTHKPDLILLDINLPDIDGYSICQQIKSNAAVRDVPIIFISASDEPWDKVKAFSAGGSDYISKPFKVVEVLARVENQLKMQRLQQQLQAQNVQLEKAIQELQRLAAIDELTQVASRRRFDAYLLEQWKLAQKLRSPLTLILAQIDHFSFYSEGENAKTGDRMLYQIAQIISQHTMESASLVARYGTLTFAIVLPGKTGEPVHDCAQRVQQEVQQIALPGQSIGLSLNVGIVSIEQDFSLGIGALLERCDRNLQQARQQSSATESIVVSS